jgi:hypothetical protein
MITAVMFVLFSASSLCGSYAVLMVAAAATDAFRRATGHRFDSRLPPLFSLSCRGQFPALAVVLTVIDGPLNLYWACQVH